MRQKLHGSERKSLTGLRGLQGKARVGITADASAPEVLVQAVINKLKALTAGQLFDIRSRAPKPQGTLVRKESLF